MSLVGLESGHGHAIPYLRATRYSSAGVQQLCVGNLSLILFQLAWAEGGYCSSVAVETLHRGKRNCHSSVPGEAAERCVYEFTLSFTHTTNALPVKKAVVADHYSISHLILHPISSPTQRHSEHEDFPFLQTWNQDLWKFSSCPNGN